MSIDSDPALEAAAELMQLSVSTGAAMLERVAESVRRITGALEVLMLHRMPTPQRAQVVASAGGPPRAGEHVPLPRPDPPRRIVLPLTLDGAALGCIVVDGITQPLTPAVQREISLLAGLGALALQNQLLILEGERQARRLAQRQHQLLTGTIYHLRNTMAVASEYMELLDLQTELSEEQREYIVRSRRSVGSALRLLGELAELGQADAGERVPVPEPLNLGALIRDVVHDYRLATGTVTVDFDIEVDELPAVRTDPDCVRQVLDNLLSNAVRYSPSDGVVTIRAAVQPGRRATDPSEWVRVDVIDRGPGVQEREEVFEELQRVSRKGPPGFRLAISRRIARLLGGDLTLVTEDGAGSTFTLWIPLVPGDREVHA